MEPFELKLHQVTFDESDGKLGQREGQTQPQLDKLNELVHYDANFLDRTGSDNPLEVASLQELTFAKSGKKPSTNNVNKSLTQEKYTDVGTEVRILI